MASTKFSSLPPPDDDRGVINRTGYTDPDAGRPRKTFGLLNRSTLPGAFPQDPKWEKEMKEAEKMWDRLGLSDEDKERERLSMFAPNAAKAREQAAAREQAMKDAQRAAIAEERRIRLQEEKERRVEIARRDLALETDAMERRRVGEDAKRMVFPAQVLTPFGPTAPIPIPAQASQKTIDALAAAGGDYAEMSKYIVPRLTEEEKWAREMKEREMRLREEAQNVKEKNTEDKKLTQASKDAAKALEMQNKKLQREAERDVAVQKDEEAYKQKVDEEIRKLELKKIETETDIQTKKKDPDAEYAKAYAEELKKRQMETGSGELDPNSDTNGIKSTYAQSAAHRAGEAAKQKAVDFNKGLEQAAEGIREEGRKIQKGLIDDAPKRAADVVAKNALYTQIKVTDTDELLDMIEDIDEVLKTHGANMSATYKTRLEQKRELLQKTYDTGTAAANEAAGIKPPPPPNGNPDAMAGSSGEDVMQYDDIFRTNYYTAETAPRPKPNQVAIDAEYAAEGIRNTDRWERGTPSPGNRRGGPYTEEEQRSVDYENKQRANDGRYSRMSGAEREAELTRDVNARLSATDVSDKQKAEYRRQAGINQSVARGKARDDIAEAKVTYLEKVGLPVTRENMDNLRVYEENGKIKVKVVGASSLKIGLFKKKK